MLGTRSPSRSAAAKRLQQRYSLQHALSRFTRLNSIVRCRCQPRMQAQRLLTPEEQELLHLTETLLKGIANRDWALYKELCDDSLTAFEPEAVGHLVQGLEFHKFYFDFLHNLQAYSAPNNTISQPHVRMLGPDAGVVSYVRLQQKVKEGRPLTVASEETRVWQRVGGRWKNVHFHRSSPSS